MARKSIAEKVFYKIWDIKNQSYVSVSHDKATWATLNGVQEKIRSMCRPDRYSFTSAQRKPEEFEIQMFHMVQFDRQNGREAFEAKEKKAQAEKLKQQAIAELHTLIKNIVPGVDFYRIREMLKSGIFSDKTTGQLTTVFNKISELEKR